MLQPAAAGAPRRKQLPLTFCWPNFLCSYPDIHYDWDPIACEIFLLRDYATRNSNLGRNNQIRIIGIILSTCNVPNNEKSRKIWIEEGRLKLWNLMYLLTSDMLMLAWVRFESRVTWPQSLCSPHRYRLHCAAQYRVPCEYASPSSR